MKYSIITAIIFSANIAMADQNFTTPFDGRLLLEKQVSNNPANPWATQGVAGYLPSTTPVLWRFRQGSNYTALDPQTFSASNNSWSISNSNSRLGFWKSFQGYSNVYEIAFANNTCREPEWDAEVDLFLDPIGTAITSSNLADMGELRLKLGYINTQSLTTAGCSVTRSTAITSLYINDTSTGKTLSLQIHIGGTDSASSTYYPFTWGGNPGIDDFINNYGGTYIKDVGQATNVVDLLPRVLHLIQTGAAGGSTDPRNWHLSGYNIGVIAFGKVNVSTNWHSIEFGSKGGTFCSGTTRTQYVCSPPTSSGWSNAGGGCYHRSTTINC